MVNLTEAVEEGVEVVERQTKWNLHPYDDLKIVSAWGGYSEFREYFKKKGFSDSKISENFMFNPHARYDSKNKEIAFFIDPTEKDELSIRRVVIHELTHYGQDKNFPYLFSNRRALAKILNSKDSGLSFSERDSLIKGFLCFGGLIEGHAELTAFKSILTPEEFEELIKNLFEKVQIGRLYAGGHIFQSGYTGELAAIAKGNFSPEEINQLYVDKKKREEIFRNV